MHTLRLSLLAGALLAGFGCKQLLKNADNVADVAKRSDGAAGAAARQAAPTFQHTDAISRLGSFTVDVGPDVLEAAMEHLEGGEVEAIEDLGGSWSNGNPVRDGLTFRSNTERKMLKPGVYTYKSVSTIENAGVSMVSLDMGGIEIFSKDKICTTHTHLAIPWVNPSLPPAAVEELKAGFTLKDANSDPCDTLLEHTADKLVYKGKTDTHTETRK